MPYDPFKHHRRSIRLRGYDYTQAGAYFVTLLAHNRECLFGEAKHFPICPTNRKMLRPYSPYNHTARNQVQSAQSFRISNRFRRAKSTSRATRRARPCGIAIITNTSFAAKNPWRRFVATSKAIPRIGRKTRKIQDVSKGEAFFAF